MFFKKARNNYKNLPEEEKEEKRQYSQNKNRSINKSQSVKET